ncbi:hypothetical protein THAOC_13517, partial [Thalassiosira oceanica]
IVGFEVGKARLSGGRRRPPAARHEGRGNADTIPWLRFVSASVIIVGPAKRARQIAPQPRASIERRLVGNNESRLIEEISPRQRRRLICKQIGTRTRGQPAEVPPRAAEEPSTDMGPEGGVDGPRRTCGAAGTQFDTTSYFSSRQFL